MLTTATKEKLAKLGISVDDLTNAITSKEEVDIEIPEGKLFSDSELQVRDSNKFNEGKTAGEEMAVKAVKEEMGLNFQGKKVKGLAEHLAAQTPTATDVEAKLRDNLTKAEREKQELQSQFDAYKTQATVFESMPALKDGFSRQEALALMKANGYEFVSENGTLKAIKNGQAVLDEKLATPMAVSDVIGNFVKEKGLIAAANTTDTKIGRGGQTQTHGKQIITKASEVAAKYEMEHGKGSLNGSGYQTHLQTIAKEATDAGQTFDYNG